jgi:hypothetical protein
MVANTDPTTTAIPRANKSNSKYQEPFPIVENFVVDLDLDGLDIASHVLVLASGQSPSLLPLL